MAYTDRRPDDHRIAKIIAVSAFHAAIGYGLVAGLGVTGIRETIANLPAINHPAEKPPPVPDVDPPKPAETAGFEEPQPQTPALPDFSTGGLTFMLPPVGDGKPVEFLPPVPKPPAGPTFAPKQPRPRNDPGSWAQTSDYPARDIREGNQGATRILLSIDADGKLLDCRIAASSGFPSLDEAACKAVSRRARFEPATNSAGESTAGSYANTIRWVIPKD